MFLIYSSLREEKRTFCETTVFVIFSVFSKIPAKTKITYWVTGEKSNNTMKWEYRVVSQHTMIKELCRLRFPDLTGKILMTKVAGSSEASIHLYQNIWRHISEESKNNS